MKRDETRFKLSLLILSIIMILSLARPAVAQSVPCYREQGGAKWVADLIGSTGCEWEMKSGATLDVQSGVTATFANDPAFSGNPDFTGAPTFAGLTTSSDLVQSDGDLTVADFYIIEPQPVISATDGGVITPTGTYQLLESAGTVTPTIETAGIVTGTHLTLINTAATTITIVDTGTAKLAGEAALGQFDVLKLLFDGTNWIEEDRSDN